jgi:hypothetical protein
MILAASGGEPPYTWLAPIDLPPGMTLATNGVLSGTPTDSLFALATAPTTDRCQFAVQVSAGGKISLPKLVTLEIDP